MTVKEAQDLIDKHQPNYPKGTKVKNKNTNEILEVAVCGVVPDQNGKDWYADCWLIRINVDSNARTNYPIEMMDMFFDIV